MRKVLCLLTIASVALTSSLTVLADGHELQEAVLEVMKMDHRTDADRARDANRAPQQALPFFGLEQDMKVIEFAPGDGWYTKILAPLLKDEGELHLAYREQWLDDLDEILAEDALSGAKKLPIELGWNNEAYHYVFGDLDFGMTDADMVLCIREYHNFSLEDRSMFNKAVLDALKPGGIYVVVDHTRRHMAPETWELRRREDPVDVILEVQAAGFELVKASDMFYRPDDELSFEVGRKTVTGNTDRFTLVFAKPE